MWRAHDESAPTADARRMRAPTSVCLPFSPHAAACTRPCMGARACILAPAGGHTHQHAWRRRCVRMSWICAPPLTLGMQPSDSMVWYTASACCTSPHLMHTFISALRRIGGWVRWARRTSGCGGACAQRCTRDAARSMPAACVAAAVPRPSLIPGAQPSSRCGGRGCGCPPVGVHVALHPACAHVLHQPNRARQLAALHAHRNHRGVREHVAQGRGGVCRRQCAQPIKHLARRAGLGQRGVRQAGRTGCGIGGRGRGGPTAPARPGSATANGASCSCSKVLACPRHPSAHTSRARLPPAAPLCVSPFSAPAAARLSSGASPAESPSASSGLRSPRFSSASSAATAASGGASPGGARGGSWEAARASSEAAAAWSSDDAPRADEAAGEAA